ncbi:MAG: MutT/nudix family protein [uncultured bacterium (gcode 4)]|uniref:MutT/nudix family protein n=1 Tax=uncultured bacterium (gcode 4) TaxID=1234023 RepID=K2G959_9BACT|nr:MAG: MutT/nudix family protein [uncultured bacterium (gcode 4)]
MAPDSACLWVLVWCLIINDKGEILLLKRWTTSDEFWTRPGWSVVFKEKVEDALKRQIREELWIEIIVSSIINYGDHLIEAENKHWVNFSFLAQIKNWEIQNLQPDRCSEIKWFSLGEIPHNLDETWKKSIQEYRELYKL